MALTILVAHAPQMVGQGEVFLGAGVGILDGQQVGAGARRARCGALLARAHAALLVAFVSYRAAVGRLLQDAPRPKPS